MNNKKPIKSYNSSTDYMGAKHDLDIYIYNDFIKWHLETFPQFSDEIIRNYTQPIDDFIKNGIPDIAKYLIEAEVLKELEMFFKNKLSNE